jgi:ATP-dependent RNA helicase DeaD
VLRSDVGISGAVEHSVILGAAAGLVLTAPTCFLGIPLPSRRSKKDQAEPAESAAASESPTGAAETTATAAAPKLSKSAARRRRRRTVQPSQDAVVAQRPVSDDGRPVVAKGEAEQAPGDGKPARQHAGRSQASPAHAGEAPRKSSRRGGRRRSPRDSESRESESTDRASASARDDGSPAERPALFAALGVNDELLDALAKLKFVTPTDIQLELIPIALQGRDCIGQAKTGTGKTAAFGLPMLQMIEPGQASAGLVLVPTRELAKQVNDHFEQLGRTRPLRTALLYGGVPIGRQMDDLRRGCEIVIGTPGRVLDHIGRRTLKVSQVRFVVLDEVDRMLDIGFRDDIRRILRDIPENNRQTIFVSATLDEDIRKLARTFMRDPLEVNVSHDVLTVDSIEQGFVTSDPHDKFPTLLGFIKHEAPTMAIVFTNTKMAARRVAKRLKDAGVNCKEIHGDLMQNRRERVMASFRQAKIQILVATDLASRGIDVMDVSHIVNYDLPPDPSVYVHRVGRTARMGRSGYAMSLVTREQGKLLTEIEKHINKELPRIEGPWVIDRPPLEPPSGADPRSRLRHGEKEGRSGSGGRGRHDAKATDGAAQPEGSGTKPEGSGTKPEGSGEKATDAARQDDSRLRDPVFESLGLRPVRRTLGSRFRQSRRGRR